MKNYALTESYISIQFDDVIYLNLGSVSLGFRSKLFVNYKNVKNKPVAPMMV